MCKHTTEKDTYKHRYVEYKIKTKHSETIILDTSQLGTSITNKNKQEQKTTK